MASPTMRTCRSPDLRHAAASRLRPKGHLLTSTPYHRYPAMSSCLRANGAFWFPDDVFPDVNDPFPGLPMSPEERLHKISAEYRHHVESALDGSSTDKSDSKKRTRMVFRWARDTLDFAENQWGVDPKLVSVAQDIVRLVGSQPNRYQSAALYISGLWHLFGLFGHAVEKDCALDLFMQSAKLGYSRSLYRLGTHYEQLAQVETALAYFEHGVKRGDSACLYRMAMIYFKGHFGKAIDTSLALRYLEKSSLTSDPDCPQSSYIFASIHLGELPGLSISNPDREIGLMALERAAWLGFGPALVRMAKAWQGGEKGFDATIALRYLHLASRQSQYALFRSYELAENSVSPLGGFPEVEIAKWLLCGSEDVGLQINEEWSFKFSSLAAELGNATGQFAVGYCYEVGIFVEGNLDLAVEWYKKSAAAGSSDAVERLRALRPGQPEQLEQPYQSNEPFQLSRQYTRKDHERSLSIRGRGSIKTTRVNSTKKPLKPTTSIEKINEDTVPEEEEASSPTKTSLLGMMQTVKNLVYTQLEDTVSTPESETALSSDSTTISIDDTPKLPSSNDDSIPDSKVSTSNTRLRVVNSEEPRSDGNSREATPVYALQTVDDEKETEQSAESSPQGVSIGAYIVSQALQKLSIAGTAFSDSKNAEETVEPEVNQDTAQKSSAKYIVEETSTSDEKSTLDQKPTIDEHPTSEQKPTIDEHPTSEQKPTIDEHPTSEQKPTIHEHPTSEKKPTPTQTSAVNEKAAVDHERTLEDNPAELVSNPSSQPSSLSGTPSSHPSSQPSSGPSSPTKPAVIPKNGFSNVASSAGRLNPALARPDLSPGNQIIGTDTDIPRIRTPSPIRGRHRHSNSTFAAGSPAGPRRQVRQVSSPTRAFLGANTDGGQQQVTPVGSQSVTEKQVSAVSKPVSELPRKITDDQPDFSQPVTPLRVRKSPIISPDRSTYSPERHSISPIRSGVNTPERASSPEQIKKGRRTSSVSAAAIAKQIKNVFKKHSRSSSKDSNILDNSPSRSPSRSPERSDIDEEEQVGASPYSSGPLRLRNSQTSLASNASTMSSSGSVSGRVSPSRSPIRSSPSRGALRTIPEPSALLSDKEESDAGSSRTSSPDRRRRNSSIPMLASGANSSFNSSFDLNAPGYTVDRDRNRSPGVESGANVFSRQSTVSSWTTTGTDKTNGAVASISSGGEAPVPAKDKSSRSSEPTKVLRKGEYAMTFDEMGIPLILEDKEDCVVM